MALRAFVAWRVFGCSSVLLVVDEEAAIVMAFSLSFVSREERRCLAGAYSYVSIISSDSSLFRFSDLLTDILRS